MTSSSSFAHYTIAEKIGAGGMGEVYRARDSRLDRVVAIKALPPGVSENPQRLARFEREARLLASLNHANVAAIFGIEDAADGGVNIRVSDTGKGIPSRDGNKIFEPGYTTKKRGWGMGLALVKRIVTEYHGGTIRVESTGPRGTTFRVHLPGEEPRSGV